MKKSALCIAMALAAAASGKTVKVSDFGYDPADSTQFIRSAIESDADTVVFDRQSGPWHACSMRYVGLKGKTILFEKGVEVRAKPGEFKPVKGPNICLSTMDWYRSKGWRSASAGMARATTPARSANAHKPLNRLPDI